MKKRVWILIPIFLAVAAGWGVWVNFKKEKPNVVKTIEYKDYKNLKAGYSVRVPVGWFVVEASDEAGFVARTVIKRTVDHLVGNIGEISVTAVASPSRKPTFFKVQ